VSFTWKEAYEVYSQERDRSELLMFFSGFWVGIWVAVGVMLVVP
jgi:hypothetical protein